MSGDTDKGAGTDPIERLQRELRDFARARDWEKYHTPRNLAALVASEAGELLALFRWDEEGVAGRLEEVRHEVADVFRGNIDDCRSESDASDEVLDQFEIRH